MNRTAICSVLLFLSGATAADPLYADTATEDHLLLVAKVETLLRRDDPLQFTKPDGTVVISNGCGYDTAVADVKQTLRGDYKYSRIAAHLEVNEFCTSLLQPEVKNYLWALDWNGTVWEIDQQLSSRLLSDEHGELWLVEPELIAEIARSGGPKAQPVHFDRTVLEELAMGQELRRGVTREPGESRAAWLKKIKTLRPIRGEWPDNPLYFRQGISLRELKAWLSANNSFKPNPHQGGA